MKSILLSNSRLKLCLTFIVLLLILVDLNSQELELEKNISLPVETTLNGDGLKPWDIINANGKVFVYGTNEIQVYDELTFELKGSITVNASTNYGKFNPSYLNYRVHIGDPQAMTYNSSENYLYVLSVNLDIKVYDISDNDFDLVTTWSRPSMIDHLAPLHGYPIIKYDNFHQRLYVVIEGRDAVKTTDIGHFHHRDVFVGVYNINNSARVSIHEELYHNNNDPGNSYENAITDIEYNQINNKFYLARNERVEIYSIDANNEVTLSGTVSLTPYDELYKIGKLMYIYHTSLGNPTIHKVLALPYMAPSDSEPPLSQTVGFWEFDADDPNTIITPTVIPSPHRRILDGVFLENQQDIVLSYSNDGFYTPGGPTGKIMSIYSFSNGSFAPPVGVDPITIQDPGNYSIDISLNRPVELLSVSGTDVIVSNIHNIGKLLFNESTGTYTYYDGVYTGESNHFSNGVTTTSGNIFIINRAKSGIEILNNTYTRIGEVQTGFAAYEVAHNPSNEKLYFFNKTNSHNNSIIVYDPYTDGGVIEARIEVTSAIGDLIYNPFQDHMLVSFNEGPNGIIKKIKSDNTIEEVITIVEGEHPGELFISPNGTLYVITNTWNETPSIYAFEADYGYNEIQFQDNQINDIKTMDVDPYDQFEIYKADYCYNPYNKKVYAIVTNNNTAIDYSNEGINLYMPSSQDPYFTILNSTLDNNLGDDTNPYYGVLLELSTDGIITLDDNLDGAREIICATPDSPPYGYSGEIFVNCRQLMKYDCSLEPNEMSVHSQKNFNDIDYVSNLNKVVGFLDEAFVYLSQPVESHRVAKVVTVDEEGQTEELYTYDGQLASIFYNSYDDKLYLHTKVDATRLGVEEVSLIQLETSGLQLNPLSVGLNVNSFYTEHDQNGDHFCHFYPLTKPYTDPYLRKIYLPNGAHSNVSVVNFNPLEILSLEQGNNYISIPRHTREPSTNYSYVVDVFNEDNFNEDFISFDLSYYQPFISNPTVYTAVYQNNVWSFNPDVPDNKQLFSKRGYKLNLNQQSSSNSIILNGSVEPPSTYIELKTSDDNWVGYFLYQEQDIFDALGSTRDYCTHIWAESWHCYYDGPTRNPGNPQPPGTGWICTDLVHNIDYGEMVVLITDAYLPANYTFTWENGYRNYNSPKDPALFYTYEENSEYTPIYVLLDSTNNPEEIGVFINDTCVGACTVTTEDSLVGILAYLDGQNGDSVSFATWYGNKSTMGEKISKYSVFDPIQNVYEQRSIYVGEDRDFYKVSFRQSENLPTNEPWKIDNFSVYPNPSSSDITIKFTSSVNCFILIEVLDMYGRNVANIVSNTINAGIHTINWNLIGNMGVKLKPGFYSIVIKLDGQIRSKKLLIQ